ncbi:hypothetical protein J6590_081224 [Homalodisca vitripennis]|nr:hypothetical protein J6590_081224 [Homalodisca vitripennis]
MFSFKLEGCGARFQVLSALIVVSRECILFTMKRANSPLSDNRISQVINEEENCSIDKSFLNNFGSEVDSSSSEVDDSDNDPTYDPDQQGPSSNILPIVSRPRVLSESESDSSIDGENVRSRLTTIHQQPR